MKSDVKAVRVSGTGAVFAGRTRLRGIILASDGGGAGSIILQDNKKHIYFKIYAESSSCIFQLRSFT